MLTMSPASFSSPAKSNEHDCPFCTCRGVNDFFISPPEEEKAHSLYARFLCIVADEWDFHGIRGFIFLSFLAIVPTACIEQCVKKERESERNKCIHVRALNWQVTKERRHFFQM